MIFFVLYSMIKQLERGIIAYETHTWKLKKPPCVLGLGDFEYNVKLVDIYAAFLILIIGIILSIVILFGEIYVDFRSNAKVRAKNGPLFYGVNDRKLR